MPLDRRNPPDGRRRASENVVSATSYNILRINSNGLERQPGNLNAGLRSIGTSPHPRKRAAAPRSLGLGERAVARACRERGFRAVPTMTLAPFDTLAELRFQRRVGHLHRLGPRALGGDKFWPVPIHGVKP